MSRAMENSGVLMGERRFDETGPAKIMRFWPFLVCVALGLIAYGAMQAQLSRAQEDIKEIRQDIKLILLKVSPRE